MARVQQSRLTETEKHELRDELMNAIRALRKEDVARFLHDLLTPSEILMLARRIRIAKALLAGNTYEAIALREKVSYSTIQLVDRAIQRGLEGYRRVLARSTTAGVHRGRRGRLPNETIEMLRRSTPGMGAYRFWLDLLDTGEEK